MVVILGLFRAFGSENFANGPALLLTEDIQHLRLDGFLTLIAITPKRLGELITLTRYLKQVRTDSKTFDMKKATASWANSTTVAEVVRRFVGDRPYSTT